MHDMPVQVGVIGLVSVESSVDSDRGYCCLKALIITVIITEATSL